MHIPDGFLSAPVWVTFDALAVPAIGVVARRAHRDVEDRQIPLLGVMGAFVFAAQMINFPVGAGTSGHLVGGALLAIVLGPWAAALVMTAILAMQAFLFQDGGILALGTNICNMALVGVFAGYLPYFLWGRSSSKSGSKARRSAAIFAGGVVSVLVSAALALSQLLISGVPMPRRLLLISMAVFLASAFIEGAITLAAIHAIERLNPLWVRAPAERSSPAVVFGVILAVSLGAALAVAGVLLASASPDGIEKILATHGLIELSWMRRALVSLAGIAGAFAVCVVVGKMLARRHRAPIQTAKQMRAGSA
jgi:cobalt/nickel transport system permease protein